MATRLQNLTRQPVTLILHAEGEDAGRVPLVRKAVIVEQHDRTTGARALVTQKRRLPGSVTLQPKGLPGDTVDGLPDAVARCPEVVAAAGRNQVGVAVVPDPVPTAPTPSPVASEETTQPQARNRGRKED